MKRLGAVLHIVDNLLIVRTDRTLPQGALRENSTVVTNRMKRIGKVKELFGPVNAPYISIRISKDTPASEIVKLKNERIYLQ